MRTEQVKIIQFKYCDKNSSWTPETNKMYFVGGLDDRMDFEDTYENDEGDEVEDTVTLKCLEVFDSYLNMRDGEDATYVPREESDWTLSTINVLINDDNEIVSLAKKEKPL